jgi:UDP-glucose 4-epimerase
MTVCLVTGGAGFLGSHLVEALVADEHAVRVVDNFTTGKTENLSGVMDAIELYPGDCGNPAFLSKVMRGVELVFHLGCGNDPRDSGDAKAAPRVLAAAVEARVRRVLFASSMRVYAARPGRPVDETDPLEPESPFGQAKRSGELACEICTRFSGLETVRLRYFNVFGPRLSPDSPYAGMIRDAFDAMLLGQSPVFESYENSEQDVIYVDDAVHATLLAARSPRVSGNVYNIARGQPTTCGEVVDVLNDLLGTRLVPEYTGRCPKSNLNNRAKIRRSEAELGFCAATDLRNGLSRCLEARFRSRASAGILQQPHLPLSVMRSSQLG